MNYNIVYIAFVSANFGGVEQKIISQYDALHSLGADIKLLLISTFSPGEVFLNEIEQRPGIKIIINSQENIKNPWARRKEKFDNINSFLKKYNPENTIIYFRFPLADFIFLRFLRKNKAFRFVTEHQSIENMLRIGIFRRILVSDIFDFIYGRRVRSLITGFVGVSGHFLENELSYLKINLRNNKYCLVNGNGINTLKIQLRSYPKFDGKILKLLFVGSAFKAHGLHRLFLSLIDYYKTDFKVEIIVHIVGVNSESINLKKYLKESKIQENVVFHGFLAPNEINGLADECHLALDGLSLHLVGQKITSTLKSREYFARGIPFITSSPADNDFDSENPYILKVTRDETPFEIQKLIDFAIKLNGDPEHPQKMRQYAIEHLDWSVKMNKLIAFFDEIMHSGI